MSRTPLVLAVAALAGARALSAATCESLASLKVANGVVTSAVVVTAGQFAPPGGKRGSWSTPGPRYDYLPAFCRVTSTLQPVPGADDKIEVWMPVKDWNGEFQPVSGGFYGGTINNYAALAAALRTGAATATSNNGHDGAGNAFMLDHPERLAYMNVSFHSAIVEGKDLIKAFYGRGPGFTFMNECGGGTRDPLAITQKYGEDLDALYACGIITTATRHVFNQMQVYGATHQDEASYIPPAKYAVIHEGAIAACDANDGVKDGVIEDPTRCKFDPGTLLCKDADGPSCLTAPQVAAVRKIYTAPVHARTGKYLYAPMAPGGELEWEEMAGPKPYPFAEQFFRNVIFKDPKWTYKARPVNFDSDVDATDAPVLQHLNANDPDIAKFIDHGGKLMLMGGWNDYTVAPGNTVDYYNAVVAKLGAKTKDSVRLFMVPDMLHCLGGTNPSTYSFDTVSALRKWKSTGKAPDSIVVTHFANGQEDRKRLVCAYPAVAAYKGAGETTDSANYTCRVPK